MWPTFSKFNTAISVVQNITALLLFCIYIFVNVKKIQKLLFDERKRRKTVEFVSSYEGRAIEGIIDAYYMYSILRKAPLPTPPYESPPNI